MDQTKDEFFQAVLSLVTPGAKVLDLGAGAGTQAQAFARLGAHVTAVDRRAPEATLPGIRWVTQSVEDFVAGLTDEYDAVFSQNLFQFIDKDVVLGIMLPRLKQHCRLIAIRTFWQQPDPSFEKSYRSLYTLEDFQKVFSGWQPILANQHEKIGLDLQGDTRRFFLTDFIAQRL